MRKIARDWMRMHKTMTHDEFSVLLTSLVKGESSTEKCMAGFLLDYSTKEQRKFDPLIFDLWLDHLIGWVEVDTLCTGHFTITELPVNWGRWKKLLIQFSKSENINKRRASIVLLCSPLQKLRDERLAKMTLINVNRLKSEKEVLITKAISWVLRSMSKHHPKEVSAFLQKNQNTLPAIAVRETRAKLETGRKTKRPV